MLLIIVASYRKHTINFLLIKKTLLIPWQAVNDNKNDLGRLPSIKYVLLVTMKMTLFYAK